ncbi:MAG: hypothetical protein WC391_01560 [Methanoregula sp.]|jgi:hypothetical protein
MDTSMKQDEGSIKKHTFFRHIVIGILLPAGIAFLILLVFPMTVLAENLVWIGLAALAIVIVSGLAALKKK